MGKLGEGSAIAIWEGFLEEEGNSLAEIA